MFILSIVLIYAVYKFQLLIDKEETRLQRIVEELYFDRNYTFDRSTGFNVAFALTSGFAETKTYHSDESYGRLRLLYRQD